MVFWVVWVFFLQRALQVMSDATWMYYVKTKKPKKPSVYTNGFFMPALVNIATWYCDVHT